MTSKKERKMNPDELQGYLAYRKRAFKVPSKKGKGSYNREKFKSGE